MKHNPVGKRILLGKRFKPARFLNLGKCSSDNNRTPFIPRDQALPILEQGVLTRGDLCDNQIV